MLQNIKNPADVNSTDFIQLRVTPREKSRWVKDAHPAKLSEFIRKRLDGIPVHKHYEVPAEPCGALIIDDDEGFLTPLSLNEWCDGGWDRPLIPGQLWVREEDILDFLSVRSS